MTFLNFSILAGLGFAAVPILLHLLMRQKPKKLLFPALRLIEQRRRQSVRRLRMKHFWLLLLRILVFGVIVTAIARPSLPPANYRLTGFEVAILITTLLMGGSVYWGSLFQLRRAPQPKHRLEERQARLRNWITAGTIAAVLLFVGFPYQRRISGELSDPRPVVDVNLPVAGVMLFDTSLSMSYLQEGQTALERAREIAQEHLQTLPAGSPVAIVENSNDHPILFQSTMLTAQSQLDNLEISPVAMPLDQRLMRALKAQQEDRTRTLSDQSSVQTDARKDRYIRRIYLFTDLSASAWQKDESTVLKTLIEETAGVNFYVVDVGQPEPTNLAITDVQLSRERIPMGGDLIVTATLVAQGMDVATQTVELRTLNSQGQPVKKGQLISPLDADLPVQLTFQPLSDVTNSSIKGEVRLATSDPLAFDNIRYFSAEVIPPPKVLVVGPEYDDVTEWIEALAPFETLDAGQNRFVPEYLPYARFKDQRLSDYTAITLINLRGLPDAQWYQLGKYVENGGGLVIVLGDTDSQIKAAEYNRPQAQVFLPGRLDAWTPLSNGRISLDERHHPLFWKFRQYENFGTFSTIENLVRVKRHWIVEPAEGANVIATYNDRDRSPAILERAYGRGRVIMLTTDASNPEPGTRDAWNTLADPLVTDWVFLAFVEQMIEYASRFTDMQHNFIIGQTPVLPVEPQNSERSLLLRQPGLKQTRLALNANATSVVIDDLNQLGHYELFESSSRIPLQGFSLNPPASESDLTRLSTEDLDQRFGEDNYKVSRGIEELKDEIDAADIGQEIFPMLLMLVVVMFVGEHLVANRFYQQNEAATT